MQALAATALFLSASGVAQSQSQSQSQTLDLTLVVVGARSSQGKVSAALYDQQGWLKTMLFGARVPAGERVVLVFRGVPAGTYALAVFHDENDNGKLDSNVLGMPTEPYGFSRDAAAAMGPPKFADAAVDLKIDTTLTVTLQ